MEDQIADLEWRLAELGQRQKQAEHRVGMIVGIGLVAAVGALMLGSVRSGSTQDAHASPLGVAAMAHARRAHVHHARAYTALHRWFRRHRRRSAGAAKPHYSGGSDAQQVGRLQGIVGIAGEAAAAALGGYFTF